MASATDEYGGARGMRTGREFWVVGRAGVLGDCTAEVAAAALGFHAPEHVYAAWEHLPAGVDHRAIAQHYLGRITEWGERVISQFDPSAMERLDGLGRRIADAAPASLGPVFAGWRAMPIPATVGGRVALTTHVLREMRMAAHLIAILAVGITPLDAILASTNAPPRTGPGYAQQMGFVGPFRDPDEIRAQRLDGEALTGSIMGGFYATLADDELDEFAQLVETTRNAIDM